MLCQHDAPSVNSVSECTCAVHKWTSSSGVLSSAHNDTLSVKNSKKKITVNDS